MHGIFKIPYRHHSNHYGSHGLLYSTDRCKAVFVAAPVVICGVEVLLKLE